MSDAESGPGESRRGRSELSAVGAVVVHFHRERDAANLVQNLVDMQGLPVGNIVVVDNGSSAGSLESELSRRGHHPRILRLPNVGYAAAMNAGYAALPRAVQHVVMLSHEVVLEPLCVSELVNQLRATPRALVGPVLTIDGSTVWSAGGLLTPVRALPCHRLQGRPVDEVPERLEPCSWLDGAMIAVNRDLLEELGGIDEDYFLYGEDVDLGLRARGASVAVLVVPQARARQSPSPRIDPYIWTRNMFVLFRKHRRLVAWLLWLFSCCAGIVRAFYRGEPRAETARRWRGVQDGVRGRSGPPPGQLDDGTN